MEVTVKRGGKTFKATAIMDVATAGEEKILILIDDPVNVEFGSHLEFLITKTTLDYETYRITTEGKVYQFNLHDNNKELFGTFSWTVKKGDPEFKGLITEMGMPIAMSVINGFFTIGIPQSPKYFKRLQSNFGKVFDGEDGTQIMENEEVSPIE